jgi:hypothetical protein
MTTEITRSSSPRLPAPHAYAAHLDRVLAKPRPQRKLRVWLAALALAGAVTALWLLL